MIVAARLRQVLSYNPETGKWIWVNAPNHNTRLNGKEAGYLGKDGYRSIRIDGVAYRSGRLAWLYMTGKWPSEEIDHANRNSSDDRWDNLREATSSLNKFNSARRSSLRGVYPTKGNRWQVQVGGVYLGVFDSREEAISIRDAAAMQMAGDFAILNQRELT